MICSRVWIFALLLAIFATELEAMRGGGNRRDKGRGKNRGRSAIQYLPPVSGQRIRLQGENVTYQSGNVEVFLRNKWGIVCDDDWEIADGNVACRQLGFSRGAEQVTSSAWFGLGSQNDSDILMDDVGCSGQERNLLTCNYKYPSNCVTLEAAGVVCQANTGCPEGWFAGSESCYFLSKQPTTRKKFAVKKCSNIGGHLVNIETEAENHFLSSLFVDTPGEPIIIGGIKKGHQWMWEKVERSSSQFYRRKRSPGRRDSRPKGASRSSRRGGRTSGRTSSGRIVPVSIDYFKWFPGWVPGNKKSEPSGKKSEKCLYLKSSFDHPDKSLGEVNVRYLYWSDDVCSRKKKRLVNGFRYLCERAKEETEADRRLPLNPSQECYRGNGTQYRGTQAFTERGTPCIKWSDSRQHTPERFPDQGLEGHNHCRNPDGDVRPWCYVNNEGKFGFCPVPQCDDTEVDQVPMSTTPLPAITTTSAPECPKDEFYCAQSVKCISELWHCDYEYDCDHKEDEVNCDYKIPQFDMTQNRGIKSHHVRETFMRTSNETCAKLCLSRMSYVCRSFAFDREDRSCQLSEVNSETSTLPFEWKYKSYVYELVSQRECDGMFTCNNGRCIDFTKVCDHHDDCGDLSDEQQDIEKCRSKENVEVRLVGDEEQAGRVEVKYLGEWGVICDDHWDNNDATVICNMLGYKGAALATGHSKYGAGNGMFMLDDVNCLGIEDSITKCKHNGWKVHDCRYIEVAGVVCQAQKACSSSQYSCGNGLCIEARQVCDGTCHCNPGCEDENGNGETNCKSASMEIVGGPVKYEGRIEIVRNGLRGTICDDSWDNKDATVVCRMVGFLYGEAVSGGTYGEGTGAIWLDDVECTGTETSLTKCSKSNWGVSDCSHSEDAGVICMNIPPQTETPQVEEGSIQIMLEDGSAESEGRVEVIYNGQRGTVCDDSWDDLDATVVCKMLGYSFGVSRVRAHYGPGSDSLDIVLDDVQCDGTESSLLACRHAGWGTSDCGHGEDAGVKCFSGEDDDGQVDTGGSDILSGITCGLRPLESNSRKKREEPDDPAEPGGPGERELDLPSKFVRIIGGFTASEGFYPWQVGVRRLVSDGIYSHWCGGTILSEHWILSAAHCFSELSKGHIVVRTGDHDNKKEDQYEQEFELEYLISHRQYDENTFNYDIALLKIKRKDGSGIKFNDHVQPACLPEETTPYTEGQKCHVSGWGKTEEGYQNLLKSARVPIISDEVCQRLYKDITDKMVCAGYLAGGIDSCAGDSGGPLVCDVNGRYTVMGATSWGAGCAEANAPGVYARVTEFIHWIKSTIKQYS